MVVIKITGNIETDFDGIKKLYAFYKEAAQYSHQNISLDFYSLKFLDGNLCALFLGLIYKLWSENKLTFSTDGAFIKEKFHVLARNGFIKFEEEVADVQKSTLNVKHFNVNNLDEFVEYVQQDLRQHQGMKLTDQASEKIMDSIIEIATNIEIHSNTIQPFFACGQFYPEESVFKFSMVDLGDGFLPAISKNTAGTINNNFDAIKWALERGNTTKKDEPGGLGLTDLQVYFSGNHGHMQIITGDAFWSSEYAEKKIKHKNFGTPCFGTMINLLFSYN